MICKKTSSRLIIIGNGFDLAHGYKTCYSDFIKNTKSKAVNQYQRSIQKHLEKNTLWYDFEESIREMSGKAFQDRILTGNANLNCKQINKYFHYLKIDLLKYLAKETSHSCKTKHSVNYWLQNAFVINFNYTKTVERYGIKPFYIHGNIDEENSVLGYDFAGCNCTYSYDETYYLKTFQRGILSFHRLLKHFLFSPKTIKKYIKRYKYINMLADSPRGEVFYNHTLCDYIIRLYRHWDIHHQKLTGYNCKNITQIVIMGHGLKADECYLDSLFRECINLKEMVLFTYAGESRESIEEKQHFLQKYCPKIRIVNY